MSALSIRFHTYLLFPTTYHKGKSKGRNPWAARRTIPPCRLVLNTIIFLPYIFLYTSDNTVIGYIKELSGLGFEVFTLCSFKGKTAFLCNSTRSRIFDGVRYTNTVHTNFNKEIVNDCFCCFRHKAFIPISVTHTVAKIRIFVFSFN